MLYGRLCGIAGKDALQPLVLPWSKYAGRSLVRYSRQGRAAVSNTVNGVSRLYGCLRGIAGKDAMKPGV